ncbi:hypothetical protein [Streptomyces tendae]|uniref:hypothetical protein n=1 Tax=Streptomyces tendae TaxID=1932 RepID=UPI003F4D3A8A
MAAEEGEHGGGCLRGVGPEVVDDEASFVAVGLEGGGEAPGDLVVGQADLVGGQSRVLGLLPGVPPGGTLPRAVPAGSDLVAQRVEVMRAAVGDLVVGAGKAAAQFVGGHGP